MSIIVNDTMTCKCPSYSCVNLSCNLHGWIAAPRPMPVCDNSLADLEIVSSGVIKDGKVTWHKYHKNKKGKKK